jgi:hypothetical protein
MPLGFKKVDPFLDPFLAVGSLPDTVTSLVLEYKAGPVMFWKEERVIWIIADIVSDRKINGHSKVNNIVKRFYQVTAFQKSIPGRRVHLQHTMRRLRAGWHFSCIDWPETHPGTQNLRFQPAFVSGHGASFLHGYVF